MMSIMEPQELLQKLETIVDSLPRQKQADAQNIITNLLSENHKAEWDKRALALINWNQNHQVIIEFLDDCEKWLKKFEKSKEFKESQDVKPAFVTLHSFFLVTQEREQCFPKPVINIVNIFWDSNQDFRRAETFVGTVNQLRGELLRSEWGFDTISRLIDLLRVYVVAGFISALDRSEMDSVGTYKAAMYIRRYLGGNSLISNKYKEFEERMVKSFDLILVEIEQSVQLRMWKRSKELLDQIQGVEDLVRHNYSDSTFREKLEHDLRLYAEIGYFVKTGESVDSLASAHLDDINEVDVIQIGQELYVYLRYYRDGGLAEKYLWMKDLTESLMRDFNNRAFEIAQHFLENKQYSSASKILVRLKELRIPIPEIDSLLNTAKAALALSNVREFIENMQWDEAQRELEIMTVASPEEESVVFKIILAEADELKKELSYFRDLHGKLSQACLLLSRRKSQDARSVIQITLRDDLHHLKIDKEIRSLEAEIGCVEQAQKLLEQVRKKLDHADYDVSHLLESIPTCNPWITQETDLLRKELKDRLAKAEEVLKELFTRAQQSFKARRFAMTQLSLNDIQTWVSKLPMDRNAIWQAEIRTLQSDLKPTQDVWSTYSQAMAHLLEGQKTYNAESLQEAGELLRQVTVVEPINPVIIAIQVEAQENIRNLWLGEAMIKGSLAEVQEKLMKMMALDPKNVSALTPLLHQVQVTLYLDQFTNEVQNTIKKAQRRSQWWFWVTIFSTLVTFGVFIFAVVYSFQKTEIFAYLTLLYTILPGFVAGVFFTHYQKENQRVDDKLTDLWKQVSVFMEKQIDVKPALLNEETPLTQGN